MRRHAFRGIHIYTAIIYIKQILTVFRFLPPGLGDAAKFVSRVRGVHLNLSLNPGDQGVTAEKMCILLV